MAPEAAVEEEAIAAVVEARAAGTMARAVAEKAVVMEAATVAAKMEGTAGATVTEKAAVREAETVAARAAERVVARAEVDKLVLCLCRVDMLDAVRAGDRGPGSSPRGGG
jgi:membrane protein involved in colicin uptake